MLGGEYLITKLDTAAALLGMFCRAKGWSRQKEAVSIFKEFQWYRRLTGGTWYYLRPYDNLYSFSHMRYWSRRKPTSSEVLVKKERWAVKYYE